MTDPNSSFFNHYFLSGLKNVPTFGGSECVQKIDQQMNLNETVSWFVVSTAVAWNLGLPGTFKALVNFIRRDFVTTQRSFRIVMMDRVICIVMLALFVLLCYVLFQRHILMSILQSHHLLLLCICASLFSAGPFSTFFVVFILPGIGNAVLLMALEDSTSRLIPTTYLMDVESTCRNVERMVLLFAPIYLLARRKAAAIRAIRHIPSSVYLGLWMAFHLRWSLFQVGKLYF